MGFAANYRIKNRKKVQSAELSREEWCEVLLALGPTDATDLVYEKLENQLGIFEDKEVKE